MIENTITALLSFLGLIAGYFLVLIAPEEIEPGYKYFVIMQNVLFSSFIATVIIVLFSSRIVSFFAIGISLLVFHFLYKRDYVRRVFFLTPLIYIFLNSQEMMIFFASLIVLLGMTVVAVQAIDYVKKEEVKKRKKFLFHILKYHSLFILVSLLPLLIPKS